MADPTAADEEVSASLRERLRTLVRAAGTNGAFAERAGMSLNSLNKYLGGTQPGPAALVRMADAAGVSVDYLVGRSADPVGEVKSGSDLITNVFNLKPSDFRQSDEASLEGFVLVPRLEVRASAGPGRQVATTELAGESHFAFRESWLRALGVAPRNAEIILADGDSMADTIQHGDLLLVDRGITGFEQGGIYVLVVNGLVLVKRLQILASGALWVSSDNPKYERSNELIARPESADLQIEGRIRWYGRQIA